MTLLIDTQTQIFSMALCVGLGLGLFYDIIRMIRRTIKHNHICINLEDLLYWIFTSSILFSFLLLENKGEVRGFIILGLAIGAYIYFKFFSSFILNVGTAILKKIKEIIISIFKMTVKIEKLLEIIFKKYLQLGKRGVLYNKREVETKEIRKD